MTAMKLTQISNAYQARGDASESLRFFSSTWFVCHTFWHSSFFSNHQSPTCPQRQTCCVWMIPLSWGAEFTPCTFICARKETHISPYYKHQAHRDQRLLGRTEIQMTFGVIWISEFLRLLTEKTVTEINSLTSWSFKASHLMASREVCSINTYWINQ